MTDLNTRGEANNNPGNLVYAPSIAYVGQLGLEIVPPGKTYRPRFARFDTAANGLRALCVLLKVYYQRHGCDTVARVISRWAPSSENDTGAYIADVAKRMGVSPQDVILLSQPETLARLATAIVAHENGRCIYSTAMMMSAAQNALGAGPQEMPRPVSLPPLPEPHAAIVAEPRPAPSVGLWQRIREMCGWGRE